MASQTPKSASTRLLTMKFMQRAVASASSPTTPKSDEGHSAKRRKISGRKSLGNPETTSFVTSVDQKAVKAALEEEECKRQIALEKQAEELGDARWVLDMSKLPQHNQNNQTPLKVVQVGFAQVDLPDASEVHHSQEPKTMKFGPAKPGKHNQGDGDSSSDSDSEDSSGSSEDSSGEDSPDKNRQASYGTPKGPRPEIKSRKSVERAKAQKFAGERRKKEVQLNLLTSISGFAPSRGAPSRGPSSRGAPSFASMKCFLCGKQGHKKQDCPEAT